MSSTAPKRFMVTFYDKRVFVNAEDHHEALASAYETLLAEFRRCVEVPPSELSSFGAFRLAAGVKESLRY